MRDGRLARPAWQTVQQTGSVVPLLQDATELRTGAGLVPQRTLVSPRKADLEGFGALRLGHEADEPL